MIRDVFSSVGDPPTPHSSRARRNKMNVENMVVEKAQENGLVASNTWVAKVMQLYSVSQVNHGEFSYDDRQMYIKTYERCFKNLKP